MLQGSNLIATVERGCQVLPLHGKLDVDARRRRSLDAVTRRWVLANCSPSDLPLEHLKVAEEWILVEILLPQLPLRRWPWLDRQVNSAQSQPNGTHGTHHDQRSTGDNSRRPSHPCHASSPHLSAKAGKVNT